MAPGTTTVLLFGDQTDSWINGLDHLYRQAASTPWLQSFLSDLTDTITAETQTITLMDRTLQESLGHFSSMQELGERYRHTTDELGMARALLLHTVRSGALLQCIKRDPHLLRPDSGCEWLGISGGLITLSALAVSEDFDALYDACLEIARLVVRLCIFTSIRSRSMEDRPGVWGWAVLGILPDELRKHLDQFQRSIGIPEIKRAKVGVTGAGWSTIIGPPSVLDLFVKKCPAVQNLAKNPLNIHALQHTVNITSEDLDFIVGRNTPYTTKRLSRHNQNLWGMDEPGATYSTWGDMLRAVCSQVLSLPLNITNVISRLEAKVDPGSAVRVIQLGSSSHASYVANTFKASGRDVSVQNEQDLFSKQDKGLPPGRIAIVGMSGRGPGSDNYEDLWEIIMSKQDLAKEVPKDRFDIEEFYCPEHGKGGKCTMTTRYGCFMDNPGHFDARFFHISPREATLMDPGHRHFLMSAYEALEMAGYSDGQTTSVDPRRIAAFYGQCSDDWHETSHPALGCDAYTMQSVQRAFGPGRLAWQFKWEGPTYGLDSACASTTSSIHLACMSLLSKDVDMAVAGAGNILSTPHSFICLSKSGVLSDTGNCKPYRDDADGYCRGDFVGAVVLKRLEDAVAHNDNIVAVVAASGRNHSGNSTSITTSDAGAQERLFRKVLGNARVSPDDISYVEMHGTGTQVGDPAEMGAVVNLFKHRRSADGPLPVGGVKGNVGHSEAAAGMAELLKCIMMFRKDVIPPQAGMPHTLNHKFPSLPSVNIEILSEPKTFRKPNNSPRRILLNNFDAAGGNACLLLEDYEAPQKTISDPRETHVIVTSSRTQAAHSGNKRRLVDWLRTNPEIRIQDVAYTTTARRMHHPIRDSYTASTVEELISKLEASADASPSPSQGQPVVFVFTGQGTHYAGMGSDLYMTSPVFRESVDLCVSICHQHGFPPFLDLITNINSDVANKTTVETQLALVTLEIGLTAFWRSAGLRPAMVMGHSLGEYAALHAAGVLSLADVLYLVGKRALLLQERLEADTCAMLAVSLPVKDCEEYLDSHSNHASCSIACINSPAATVISGSSEDITQLQKGLQAGSAARTKLLSVPYGFHSFQMDYVLADYASIAEGVTYSSPKIPVASTLLGSVIHSEGTFSGRYLGQQTRQPVNFVEATESSKKYLKTDPIWLELGPSPVCGSFVRATLYPSTRTTSIMSTLKAPPAKAWSSISDTLAEAYARGVDIDWLALHAPYASNLKLLNLPAYSWDMKNYWVTYTDANKEAAVTKSVTETATPLVSTCAQYVVEKSLSPSSTQVTLRASLTDTGFAAALDGHKMGNEPIAAGSIFCEAAFAGALYTLELNGRKEDADITKLGLRRPDMTRPLTKALVGSEGELHTTIMLNSSSPNDIKVKWKAVTFEGSSFDIGTCGLVVTNSVESLQTSWDRMSYFVKARMDEIIQAAKSGRGHRFMPDIFYALFSRTVEYAPNFKGVKEAYISADFSEAAAEVVLQQDPPGTRFAASPYWGESITHLAGFICNANPRNGAGMTFINGGFERFEQTVALEAGKSYFVYARVAQEGSDSRTCDIFVFQSDSRLVAQCVGLHFHEISNAVLSQVLGGKTKPTNPRGPATTAPRVQVEAPPASHKAPLGPHQATQPSVVGAEKSAEPPSQAFIDVFLKSMSQETGIDISELTDDTRIADAGVDSIMAIEISSQVSNATGLDLTPSFVIQHQTIGDLRLSFNSQQTTSDPEPVAPHGDSSTPQTSESSGAPSSTSSSTGDEDYVVLKEPSSAPDASFPGTTEPRSNATFQQEPSPIDETSPQPNVRITLLKGRSRKDDQDTPPFYMIADGTGSIATYIHLPQFINSKMPFYGVDSPFLRCPTRMTTKVGIPGAARLIVEALVKKQPHGVPFWVGGFSGGAMIAYEVCRQLTEAGHTVKGLLLIDMCCPRSSDMDANTDVGLAMFDAISGQDDSGVWNTTDTTSLHLQSLFASVATYHPPQRQPPAQRTAIIWAAKGMIDRCARSDRLMKMLKDQGISTQAYPGFMEDPKFGAVAWSLPHKTAADLGPNGWDKYVGEAPLCLSVDADHLEVPTPGFVHLLAGAMEQSFNHFRS